MTLQLLVTVTIGKREPQPTSEFKAEDGKAMIPYIQEKIRESLNGAWQYNAQVVRAAVKKHKRG